MKKLSIFLLALTAQSAWAEHPVITGFYLEAALGGTQLEVNLEQAVVGNSPNNFLADFPNVTNLGNGNTTGWLGVGYAYHLKNHLVFGLEATAGFDNPRLSHQDGFINDSGNVSGTFKTKIKNDFAVLFKAGYLIMGHTQVYGFVGPRWGNFESSLTTSVLSSGTFSAEEAGYELGITTGLGMEHWVSNHLTLGLEYAYTSYGSLETLSASALLYVSSPAFLSDTAEHKASTNSIVAKLAYHF
jgi:opacity protein-like surface antigen